MPEKKEIPPISPDTFPQEFDVRVRRNGNLSFKVVTDSMCVIGRLTPDYAVALLAKWVEEIYEKAFGGGSFEDTPFAKAGIKLHPNVRKFTDEELLDALNGFINNAAVQAMRSVLLRMAKLPAQVFIEGIISVVLDMEESEIIKIEGSRAEIWNEYTGEVGRIVKRELDVPVVVKPRRWTKPMERKALKLYEDTFPLLRELKKTYFSSQTKKIQRLQPDLKSWEEVLDQHPQIKHVLVKLPGRNARELAVEYVGQCLGSASPDTTWDHIKKARRERRLREKRRAPGALALTVP